MFTSEGAWEALEAIINQDEFYLSFTRESDGYFVSITNGNTHHQAAGTSRISAQVALEEAVLRAKDMDL